MTLADMRARTQLLLGDTKNSKFTPGQIISMLNSGARRTIELVNECMTQVLDVSSLENTVDSSSSFSIADLTVAPENGIRGLRNVFLTGGKECTRVSFIEYQEMVKRYDTFPIGNPIYYVRGNYIFPKPATASTTQIDIYYRRSFSDMSLTVSGSYTGCAVTQFDDSTNYIHVATSIVGSLKIGETITVSGCSESTYNGSQTITGLTSTGFIINVAYVSDDTATIAPSTTECELDATLHEIIIGLCLEDYVDYTPAAARAYANARSRIADINAKYPESLSPRLGRMRDPANSGTNYLRNILTG